MIKKILFLTLFWSPLLNAKFTKHEVTIINDLHTIKKIAREVTKRNSFSTSERIKLLIDRIQKKLQLRNVYSMTKKGIRRFIATQGFLLQIVGIIMLKRFPHTYCEWRMCRDGRKYMSVLMPPPLLTYPEEMIIDSLFILVNQHPTKKQSWAQVRWLRKLWKKYLRTNIELLKPLFELFKGLIRFTPKRPIPQYPRSLRRNPYDSI